MLYNLVRPPDEPCTEIVKNGCEQKKGGEKLICYIHNLSKQLWILQLLCIEKGIISDRYYFFTGNCTLPSSRPSIPPSTLCETCNLCTWPLVLFQAALQSHSKKVCGFGGENKQPPHFILPRLGRSSLLLSTLPAPRFQRKAHIKHGTLGKSRGRRGREGLNG